jgi:hypothetical protein
MRRLVLSVYALVVLLYVCRAMLATTNFLFDPNHPCTLESELGMIYLRETTFGWADGDLCER